MDKREIFSDVYDYERFILSLVEFNNIEPVYSLYLKSMKDAHFRRPTSKALDVGRLKTPLVEIIAYSLLPNHFHLLVKQKEEGGISELMKRVGGGYTKFYNNKHDRSGSLFQGKFKSVHVDSQDYLEYLSAYINGNPEIHKIEKAEKYRWNSYSYYLGKKVSDVNINKNIILKNFQSIDEYQKFVDDVIKSSRERKDDIEKYYLE